MFAILAEIHPATQEPLWLCAVGAADGSDVGGPEGSHGSFNYVALLPHTGCVKLLGPLCQA